VTQDGVDRPLVANTRIRLTFGEGGQLGVAAGCNSMGAAYQIADAKLQIADAASTMIGCNPPLQAQDEWVFGFMGSSPTVALAGNDLTLTGDGLLIQFVDEEQAVPDMGLAGPTWTVTTVVTGDVASSVPMGIVATLRFGEDGSVNVATGCNTGSGSYTVNGTNIVFGPIALTKMGCSGGAGQMERFVVGVLESQGLTFAIDGSSLTLSAGGNGLILTGE
jgi:heat shock protein HslJ